MHRKLLPSEQKEKYIESYLVQKIKKLGGIAYKFTSPQRRSVPDRLCVLPYGHVLFVECKRPGGTPTDAQIREMDKLKQLDHWVYVVTTRNEVDKLYEYWVRRLDDE